ncbi:hypothetical protein [Amantichitinum ursilacus]|uniref:Invasion associated locus B (IalB) protein n=1 Tax=Amantichitinum ursilacus TaxID=857265 RepID=A0A0N1JRJ6_9NEIS|nr:hypothetical protein [Amantichitinum ursilacus]KPC49670.1 hypothetical protein WG78_20145 [Amantichitinum ursilacus]
MNIRHRSALAIALLAAVTLAQANQPTTWQVAKPVAGQSLQTATLPSTTLNGDSAHTASLSVACQPNAEPYAYLSIGKSANFNTTPFEGAAGAGIKEKLVSVDTAKAAAKYNASGAAQGPNFAFSLQPTKKELAAWLSNAGKPLKVEVASADGKGKPLVAQFNLPSDAAALKQVLQPCL